MLIFLRGSPLCLCLKHNKTYITPSFLHSRILSNHASTTGTSQTSKHRSTVAHRSMSTFQQHIHNKPKNSRDNISTDNSRPNLLEQTKVQDYLDYVASTNDSVTLEDIERYRHKIRAIPGTPEYAEDYNSLLENLVRSFSKVQLARFLELYGLGLPAKRTKWYYAESIIERQWKWPSLTNIQKRQRDWSEIIHRTFPLNPSQAFLILGKDGVNLHSLSQEYNVHVSFSANPLSLRVEGLRGSLDNIGQYITSFKDDVRVETFDLLGRNLPESEVLQRISRITGVLTENDGGSSIRMSYRNSEHQAATVARKFIIRSVFEPTSVFTLVETQGSSPTSDPTISHSLYPFLSPRSSPWDVGIGNLIRLRRVGEWLRVDSSQGLRDTALTANDNRVDIRDTLLQQLDISSQKQNVTGSHRKITASFGHVLACTTPPLRTTLSLPQVQGNLPQMLAWFLSQKRVFIPSLPGSLLETKFTQPRLIHRVQYHVLPDQPGHSSSLPSSPSASFFKAEFRIQANPEVLSSTSKVNEVTKYSDTVMHVIPKYWTGVDVKMDLMLPNCSMDIRLLASDSMALGEDLSPPDLQSYFRQLQSFLLSKENTPLPEPPLSFVHQGVTYGLKSTCSVRQSVNLSGIQPLESGLPTLPTVSENILDLDSDEKYTVCELTCPDVTSHNSWSSFLHTCNQLVVPTLQPILANRTPTTPFT